MGTILSSKLKGDSQVIFDVLMDYEEAVQLQGHMDNVHIFSENSFHVRTNVSTRGKNSATKYLLIPKELRKGINFEKEISCQKVDLKDRIIFVYGLKKN